MIGYPPQILAAWGMIGDPVVSISGLRNQSITHFGLFYYYEVNKWGYVNICVSTEYLERPGSQRLLFRPHVELNANSRTNASDF